MNEVCLTKVQVLNNNEDNEKMVMAQLQGIKEACAILIKQEANLCIESKDTLKILVSRDELMGQKRNQQAQPKYEDKLLTLEKQKKIEAQGAVNDIKNLL